ncbi:uncharacterized protein [Rutidosis leptorrhynchoides]|uniref:uncharacterized protein n=1 Tax=Rutidosis leptorrhynchoides TaxID=125765 RepID=UPI003A99F3AB
MQGIGIPKTSIHANLKKDPQFKKKGIYWNSICHHHKLEISSVVRCHAHDKLVDVHRICESCLLSSDTKTKNKFSDETFRLLAGKTKFNPLVEDENRDSSGSRICFCCNEQYVSRDYVKHFLSTSSVHNDAKNEKNIFVDKSLDSLRTSQNGTTQVARSPEFEYHKVDVDSDNESEHLFSVNGGIRAFDLEVHLKPGSQFEVHDLHNGPAIIERRDFEEPKWQNDVNKENLSQVTEQISFDEVPQSSNLATPVDPLLETTDPSRKDDLPKDPVSDGDPSATANGHQVSNYLDLGDAYKLAISAKGRQLSGKLLDHKSFKESSTRVSEDLKILLSYRSNDNLISPKRSLNSDESTQFLQSRISLERNESNLSFDGSILSEIDGENVVDRLERQVEHDKKTNECLV